MLDVRNPTQPSASTRGSAGDALPCPPGHRPDHAEPELPPPAPDSYRARPPLTHGAAPPRPGFGSLTPGLTWKPRRLEPRRLLGSAALAQPGSSACTPPGHCHGAVGVIYSRKGRCKQPGGGNTGGPAGGRRGDRAGVAGAWAPSAAEPPPRTGRSRPRVSGVPGAAVLRRRPGPRPPWTPDEIFGPAGLGSFMVLWGPFLSLDRETRGKVLQSFTFQTARPAPTDGSYREASLNFIEGAVIH
ncbi:uncharacterized protein LOC112412146 [Neophocaena asiaeorientalis asiaeorientalis]|uniref:Uncharacterized protein LOC112412146 n=1 Tax=Neophocaena asiaeorientalis asiaeorientalis TaxID=1706337 RepID=A0A341D051_NEOAA|nr:uncharacterized protein LOC112412146 [Neophocaena asiaeorientalis asiaeorientalis]